MNLTYKSMLRPRHILLLIPVFWAAALMANVTLADDDENSNQQQSESSMMLDIADHYQSEGLGEIEDFHGQHTLDGIPFSIGGRAPFYGESWNRRGKELPVSADGIVIGRCFDELHLIHHSFWPDVEGETIARVRLNYADGTSFDFPIRYGVHLRDWMHLPSYEKETVSDQETKICWRHAARAFKAPERIYKTKITNPLPEKVVDSMDVVSAKRLASYALVAATVADAKDITSPEHEGDRNFDSRIAIRIVDDETGQPIENVLVTTSMHVAGEGVVGQPFRSNAGGFGVIRYPESDTTNIGFVIEMDGYKRASKSWRTIPAPQKYTVRLERVTEANQTRNNAVQD